MEKKRKHQKSNTDETHFNFIVLPTPQVTLPVLRHWSQCLFESICLPWPEGEWHGPILFWYFSLLHQCSSKGYSSPGVSLSLKVSFPYLLAQFHFIAGLFIPDKETGLPLKGHSVFTRYSQLLMPLPRGQFLSPVDSKKVEFCPNWKLGFLEILQALGEEKAMVERCSGSPPSVVSHFICLFFPSHIFFFIYVSNMIPFPLS